MTMVFSVYYNPSIFNLIFASFLCLLTHGRKYHVMVDAATRPPGPSSSLYMGGVTNITSDMSDEQRLFYTIMTGYEKAVRPTKKANDPVVVKLGITLTQIMDIVRDEIQIRCLLLCIFRMNVIK